MNSRRGFLSQILKAGVAAMVMPSAVTYARAKFVRPADAALYAAVRTNIAVSDLLTSCNVVIPSVEELEALFTVPPLGPLVTDFEAQWTFCDGSRNNALHDFLTRVKA